MISGYAVRFKEPDKYIGFWDGFKRQNLNDDLYLKVQDRSVPMAALRGLPKLFLKKDKADKTAVALKIHKHHVLKDIECEVVFLKIGILNE